MIRYRSLRRALKRGHYVDVWSGTYKSKREQRIYRKKYEALMKKENKDGTGED